MKSKDPPGNALVFAAASIFAQTNVYVAADGSAPFKSVQQAIMSVPSGTLENPVTHPHRARRLS